MAFRIPRRVVRRQGLIGEIHEARQIIRAEWAKFPALMRFLEDFFPAKWDAIKRCGLGRPRTLQDSSGDNRFQASPNSCHEVPYCIRCSEAEARRRTWTTLDYLHRATPGGQKTRLVHVVQTAPIYERGDGWGVEASQDIKRFGSVVWGALGDLYGTGIGAVMSYQDFGEQAFKKRHPHMDLTLNGWMLQDGKPAKTPTYDLTPASRARWDRTVRDQARRHWPDADIGNVSLSRVVVGHMAYYAVLKYQMRELVDLRKLDYSRDQDLVWWNSYRDNTRTRMTTKEFLDGFIEYQERLGVWGTERADGSRQQLHTKFGHMRKDQLGKTERAMDGNPIQHGRGCPCSKCGDWDRVFLDDVEEAVGMNGVLKSA